jgi:low temperature requirement protein LtrA
VGIRVEQPAPEGRVARTPWLVPPRLRTSGGDDGERHASWLELFFDLVFVVAIAELSHQLVLDHSAMGFVRFAALFVPVFVAWQGYMAYANRFDTDDLAFRATYLAAMLAIAAMAVQIGDVAHGHDSAGFAIAYVVLRTPLLGLYWRAWRVVPEARPLIRFYGGGYAAGAAIWLASLAVDPPVRYGFWVVAQVVELSLPPLTTRLHQRVRMSASHTPERWALLTLIVLGESVVAVALQTADAEWRLVSATAAALGFTAVAGVWWLYFDRQANVALGGSTVSVVVYSYAHLPLLMGLAAASAGLRLLIERAGEDHLGAGAAVALLGGVAVFLASLVVTRSVTVTGSRRLGASLKLGAAAAILALLAVEGAVPPVVIAAALAVVLVGVVAAEGVLVVPDAAAGEAQPVRASGAPVDGDAGSGSAS